jgi:NADP-dependent 3-hydroxy acid dehydrogenase YdfG/acyl carrier protein
MNGAYIVTGGLGGLGLQSAMLLAKQGAQHIFLVSRSGRIAYEGQGLEEDLRWLQSESGAQVHIVRCDVSDEAAVVDMLQSVRQTAGSISGVIHCAGVIKDGLLRGGNAAAGCADVWNAKALSAWWLHKHTIGDDTDVRVYLSSVTAAIGNAGQTAYGAANRFLDALAEQDTAAGKRAVSLRLPAVADVGMAADLLKKQTVDVEAADWSITAAAFRELLQRALTTDTAAVLTVIPPGYATTMPASVKLQYQNVLEHKAPVQAAKAVSAVPRSKPSALKAEEIAQIVRSNICALADTDAVADDCILVENGFDSLSGLDLVQRLSRALDVTVPVTLLYDYPTPAKILAFVADLTSAATSDPTHAVQEDRVVTKETAVFASYFPDSGAPISRVVLFPAMGQPTTSWHDIALRFKRNGVEVHIARFPGSANSPFCVAASHLHSLFLFGCLLGRYDRADEAPTSHASALVQEICEVSPTPTSSLQYLNLTLQVLPIVPFRPRQSRAGLRTAFLWYCWVTPSAHCLPTSALSICASSTPSPCST